MENEADQTISHVSPANARTFVKQILVNNGVVNEAHANIVANCLVEADLRGVDTHGKFAATRLAVAPPSSGD
jgi:LDH2 family malate/lactate/ureidoglycolate dehydrogenase